LRTAAHVKEATVSRNGPQDASPGEPIVPAGATRSTPSGPNIAAKLDAADILASVGAALYYWDIESDTLVWSSNVLDVLRVTDIAAISTGRRYAQLLDAGNVQARFDAVMQTDQRDEGRGVFFQTEYCIRLDSGSGAKLWIEDSGRWFAGPTGRPVRAHGIVRVVTERHESNSRLSYLAYHDGLTGGLNRHRLTVILGKTLEAAMRSRSACGFLLVAIDNLGRINDSYGFDIADEVIGAVAKRIRGRMRGKDSLGRYSGTKFGIVLTECTPDDMVIAADRLLAGVRDEMVSTAAGPIPVTVTIGGVTAPRHARSVPEVLARAKEALDAAKGKGRGSFFAYRPNLEREALRRDNMRATDEIVAALNERRIFLAYETVVASITRLPAFYECLMRVRRTDGTLLGASDVVPIAERLGLVRFLGHRVLELVVSELAAAPALQASVNVSPGRSSIRCCAPIRRVRAFDRRNHRERRNPRRRRDAWLCRPRQGSRLPHCHRRFRRRLHLVPQPAQARRRYRQDRRRLRGKSHPLRGRPRLRAHAHRPRPAARPRYCRRVGAGRAHGQDARSLGLRVPAGRTCRPRLARAAVARRQGSGGVRQNTLRSSKFATGFPPSRARAQ
jgi:diguanylate cyclase (GGDEF)-like protein